MIRNAVTDFNEKDYDSNTVIGEFSGRDSVAAIMKAFQSDDINFILPIATFSGTEYGDYDVIYDNYIKLKEVVENEFGSKKTLYPLIEYNREDLWSLLNGRYISEIVDKFNFYNPCIGCHLYFHLTKIPFAKNLSRRIISGERESHDGKIKVNQLHISLEFYKMILSELGFDLLMPIQYSSDNKEIEDLIKWNWEEGKDHPKCVLSGNYRDASGKAKFNKADMKECFDKYLGPVGNLIGKHLLDELDLDTLAKEIKDII